MTTYEFSIMCRWCEETIVETTRELLQLAGVSEVKLV